MFNRDLMLPSSGQKATEEEETVRYGEHKKQIQ